jgi:hypothetical protein
VPPRYAYWTILIDNGPTAFRAREQAELLPTFQQLKRANRDVVLRWFARGKLWDSPEQAQWARKNVSQTDEERRREWRPGGQHEDPRHRFKKGRKDGAAKSDHIEREARPDPARSFGPAGRERPWRDKPVGPPRERKPWSNRPPGAAPHSDRPWRPKAGGAGERRPWRDKPVGPPRERKPSNHEPPGDLPRGGSPGGFEKPEAPQARKPKPEPPERE